MPRAKARHTAAIVEQLMRELMNYDAEFRRDDQTGANAPMLGTDKD
jgi:hypothetical protein